MCSKSVLKQLLTVATPQSESQMPSSHLTISCNKGMLYFKWRESSNFLAPPCFTFHDGTSSETEAKPPGDVSARLCLPLRWFAPVSPPVGTLAHQSQIASLDCGQSCAIDMVQRALRAPAGLVRQKNVGRISM